MMIAELRQAGMSYYKIALVVGVDVHQVKRWGNGVEPSHSHGEALIEFHVELMANRHHANNTPVNL